MLNALQGGQVLAEFRGISPAERDRLVQAMGDKIRIEELSWTLNLLVVFNVEKKPFDDVRVRKALLMAIDRWGGSQGLSRISTLRSVGGVIRPGSPMATPEAELVKLPGFSKDIKKSREEAKKLLAEAGVPNLKFVLWNRNLAMPYTPAGIFLVDQWRQIGVEVEHKQSDTGALSRRHEQRQLRRRDRLLQPVHGRLRASASPSICRSTARRKTARARTIRELDKLYDEHMRERDPEKRKAHDPGVREARCSSRPISSRCCGGTASCRPTRRVMGWKMSPSHNLGAGPRRRLAERVSIATSLHRPLAAGQQRPRPRRRRNLKCSATPSTACC